MVLTRSPQTLGTGFDFSTKFIKTLSSFRNKQINARCSPSPDTPGPHLQVRRRTRNWIRRPIWPRRQRWSIIPNGIDGLPQDPLPLAGTYCTSTITSTTKCSQICKIFLADIFSFDLRQIKKRVFFGMWCVTWTLGRNSISTVVSETAQAPHLYQHTFKFIS